jgi:NAD(P)-dependent dehydrogenase (short-subunit alcohol dehydrogenase family)
MAGKAYLVTGSASGIGRAAVELIERRGDMAIGVDRADADVVADLGTVAGRAAMVAAVERRSDGRLDGVIACAGLGGEERARTREEAIAWAQAVVRVNYFGAVATLDGLRPSIERNGGGGAAVVTSLVAPVEADEPLIAACLAGDEEHALELAAEPAYLENKRAYAMTKRALARWVRRAAPSPDWAAAGISLNAVGPAVIDTRMGHYLVDTEEKRRHVTDGRPMPLRGFGQPEHVASLLAWLTSADNGFVTGQVVFADGGYDAVTRGDNTW